MLLHIWCVVTWLKLHDRMKSQACLHTWTPTLCLAHLLVTLLHTLHTLALMSYALHAYLFASHVAYLALMPRLHHLSMHALPLELSMKEVELLVCSFGLHFFWNWNCIHGFLGHHALKCAIGGPRTKDHVPWSLRHDKGCVGAYICLKCIAMPCFALCCCQTRILQEDLAGRPSLVPTGHHCWPMQQIGGRWSFPLAGGHSPQPVVFHSVQRAYPGTCTIFRGAEQRKQRQLLHGGGFLSRTKHALHWTLFLRLILLLN